MSEVLAEISQHEEQTDALLVFEVQNKNWRDEANCKDADAEEFFVEGRPHHSDPNNLRERYCKGCVVRADCLAEDILLGDIGATVQGGLVKGERRQLRRLYVKQQTVLEKVTKEQAQTESASRALFSLPEQRKVSRHIYIPDDKEISYTRQTITVCPSPKVPVTPSSDTILQSRPESCLQKKSQLGIEAVKLLMAQGRLRARLLANRQLLSSLSDLSMITDNVDTAQVHRLRDENVIFELQLEDYPPEQAPSDEMDDPGVLFRVS